MDRLSDLAVHSAATVLVVTLSAACKEPATATPQTARFAAIKKAPASSAASANAFCEHVFPATGREARRWAPPPDRPIPGYTAPSPTSGGWRWINVWASWCAPCLAEMPLIRRWQTALANDGISLDLEMWSIDEEENALVEALTDHGRFPNGPIRWLDHPTSLGGLMQGLGVPLDTAIPLHGWVDPNGQLRCVRVGAVKEASYGAVRSILRTSVTGIAP